MKKTILSIALCTICCAVFAQQKNFKQLNYYTGGEKQSMLDYGIFNTRKTPPKPRALTGTINISLLDSTITILDNGIANDKFKLKTVQPEITNQDGSRTLTILTAEDKSHYAKTITILRDQVNTAKNEMKFIMKYIDVKFKDSPPTEYDCTYLENLFEN